MVCIFTTYYQPIFQLYALNSIMNGFFNSASFFNWKKINKLQRSCLRTIMAYIKSTSPEIEIKTICSPFNIRYHWFAGNFFLKPLSYSKHLIFDIFIFCVSIEDMSQKLYLFSHLLLTLFLISTFTC